MAVDVSIYLEDIAGVLADGYTTIRLYRDTAPDGSFSSNNGGSATLVAGTEEYTITDSDGAAGSWFRYDLYTGSTASAKSDPFQVLANTFSDLRVMLAARLGAGRRGTCSADGTTTYLTDTSLLDDGVDSKFLEGAWIYRPNAAASGDKLRRVKQDGFDATNGYLYPSRSWTNNPTSGEVYHVFGLFPPVATTYGSVLCWGDFLNQALREAVIDQVNLGEGTTTGKRKFDLGAHLYVMGRNDIRRVLLRTTDANSVTTDRDAMKGLGFWEPVVNGPNDLSIEITPSPSTSETVIVEVNRRYPPLYADTDITEADKELLLRCATFRAYRQLNMVYKGRYAEEMSMAYRDWMDEYLPVKPGQIARGA